MKSIIYQASSVAKAIEESWQKAEKPLHFSVKILEVEKKNFLGMTKSPAKIAFFFEEKAVKKTAPRKSKEHAKPVKIKDKSQNIPLKRAIRKSLWTDQMTNASKKWVQDMLYMMKLSHIKFSVTTTNNNIKFRFESPLLKDPREQKALFSNFAFLLMQTLRYKFKKQFRNLKAVFTIR